MTARVIVTAPAKVNLYLHITGARPDGYHLLDSLVAFAGLSDVLTLEPAAAFRLAVEGPFAAGLGGGADNLALRAARALHEVAGAAQSPVAIRIEKNVPLAAGLGGGSADAAAVLAGLSRLWGIDAGIARGVAPGLGADVPVCLAARPVFMAGIGELLGPEAALPDAGLLLAGPGMALGTKAVFDAFDAGTDGGGAHRARAALAPAPADAQGLARALAATANELTPAAMGLAPAIGEVLAAIAALPGCRLARMSGSGPTCFGLFDDARAAARGAGEIKAARPGWWGWGGGFAPGMTIS